PLLSGERVLALHKTVGGRRLSLVLYFEDLGAYLESEPLFSYERSVETLRAMERARRLLSAASHVRLDLDEEGNVVLSAATTVDDILEAVSELEEHYPRVVSAVLG
nr:hypothetical protein [Desulfurococcales archaeon]